MKNLVLLTLALFFLQSCSKETPAPAPEPNGIFAPNVFFWNMHFEFDDRWAGEWDYHWDFGDGASANATKGDHVYKSNGAFSVELTLTRKSDGKKITHTELVLIDPEMLKTRVFAPDYAPSVGDALVFSNGKYYVLGATKANAGLGIFEYREGGQDSILLLSTAAFVSGYTAFAQGSGVYVLAGSDFWRYDIGSKQWAPRAPFPGDFPESAQMVYRGGGEAFLLEYAGNVRRIWEYDLAADTWALRRDDAIAGAYNYPSIFESEGQVFLMSTDTVLPFGVAGHTLFKYLPDTYALEEVIFRASGSMQFGTLYKSFPTEGGILTLDFGHILDPKTFGFVFFETPSALSGEGVPDPFHGVQHEGEEKCFALRINEKFRVFVKDANGLYVCKEK